MGANDPIMRLDMVTEEQGEAALTSQHLPKVTNTDNGKKLGVEGGKWTKVSSELPTVSGSDNGKKLGVDSGKWKAVNAELPAVAAADNGSVLEVIDGAWAKSPFIIAVNVALTTGEGTMTATLDKKAAALYDAVSAGKMVKATVVSFNGEAISGIEKILPLMAAKDATDEAAEYGFSYVDEGGTIYTAEELAATDDVALTATVS